MVDKSQSSFKEYIKVLTGVGGANYDNLLRKDDTWASLVNFHLLKITGINCILTSIPLAYYILESVFVVMWFLKTNLIPKFIANSVFIKTIGLFIINVQS